MTVLSIVPDVAKKRARLAGTFAAGEHVAVTLSGMAAYNTSALKLRVMSGGKTLAMFPLEDGDEWAVSGEDLSCELNLNTQQMMKRCRAPEQDVLFVLEDASNCTLYFVEEHTVRGWPPGRGDEELVDLDGYVERVCEMAATLGTLVSDFTAHKGNTNNPHGVTKGQIGLGRVNNTSDEEKPLSQLQRAAIEEAVAEVMARVNGKLSKSAFASLSPPAASIISLKNWAATVTALLKS